MLVLFYGFEWNKWFELNIKKEKKKNHFKLLSHVFNKLFERKKSYVWEQEENSKKKALNFKNYDVKKTFQIIENKRSLKTVSARS